MLNTRDWVLIQLKTVRWWVFCVCIHYLYLATQSHLTIVPNYQVSDAARYLERTFLSPASIKARFLLQKWMEDAGLRTLVFYISSTWRSLNIVLDSCSCTFSGGSTAWAIYMVELREGMQVLKHYWLVLTWWLFDFPLAEARIRYISS